MFDEALRRRIDPHRPHAGVGVERVGVSAECLVDLVLEQAVDQNDVPAGELLPAGHLLLDELAMVNDELHVEACMRLQAWHSQLFACLMLRSRRRKAK